MHLSSTHFLRNYIILTPNLFSFYYISIYNIYLVWNLIKKIILYVKIYKHVWLRIIFYLNKNVLHDRVKLFT